MTKNRRQSLSQVLGLDLAQLPDGLTPTEAVVVVKCLDESGDPEMYYDATPELNCCEALGMLRWASLEIERDITDPGLAEVIERTFGSTDA